MKFRKSLWLTVAMVLAVVLSSCSLGATPAPTADPGVIQTQAVSIVFTQVAMQQTQTALAIPPTPLPTNTPFPTPTLGVLPTFAPVGGLNTPSAFNTQLPGLTPLVTPFATIGIVSTVTTKNGCNDGTFMGESAPYDKDAISPEKKFSKSWMILNSGTCTWDEGYSFTFLPELSTPGLGGYSIVLKKNAPDEYTKPQSTQTFVVKLTAPKAKGEYKGFWKLRDDAGNYFGPLVSVWIIVK
ncbi:MAG: hypothetical protein HY864_11790 [Chloroflexi bacterium]|nr:hypothetical protein [Chloroflexota bacterium]